jgi:hypothetical protein
VADACLVAGCGLLILYVLRYTNRMREGGEGRAADDDEAGRAESGGDAP